MNTTFKFQPCTCDNQILLSPGYVCETCMGIVGESREKTDATRMEYDASYFEQLEDQQLQAGFAA